MAISSVPSSPRVGETISFTVWPQQRPGHRRQVVLTNDLPAGADLVCGADRQPGQRRAPRQFAHRPSSARWPPASRSILSFTVRAAEPGILTDAATYRRVRPDSDPGNNRSVLSTDVAPAEIADLAVAVIPVPQPATVGRS